MNLHFIFENDVCSKIILAKFMMVDILSIYTAIISRPTLNRLRAMVSTYHMVIKFLIMIDIKKLKSNLRESH